VRSWQIYPCATSCQKDPGLTITTVVHDPPGDDATNPNGERLTIRNSSRATIDLAPYLLVEGGSRLTFPPGALLKAGEAVEIRVGRGADTRLLRYWGKSAGILANGGGAVRLTTYGGVPISCKAWKSGTC